MKSCIFLFDSFVNVKSQSTVKYKVQNGTEFQRDASLCLDQVREAIIAELTLVRKRHGAGERAGQQKGRLRIRGL